MLPKTQTLTMFPIPHSSPPAAAAAADSASSLLTHSFLPKEPASGDRAAVELIRRRGRPRGSKNKPKPAVVISRGAEPGMEPYVLEVPGGSDIVRALSRFSRRQNTGLCVLTCYGTVADVTLRPNSSAPEVNVSLAGPLDIISVRATFMPHTTSLPLPNGFTIMLAGPQGQVFGGLTVGALVAAGPVVVVAASLRNPSYQRLPFDDEVGTLASGESDGRESGGLPLCISSAVRWIPAAGQPPSSHGPY